MNVNQFNGLLLKGQVDREDMWPRLMEYETSFNPYFFEFGLQSLPQEPGVIVIRGPRQYGKSTWLDLQIRNTIQDFGKGTALYANGDEILEEEKFYNHLIDLENTFMKNAKIRRIFVDEITSIGHWERAIKRAYDQGHLRKTLIVTTGSKALDLRRGTEKLPGRKGHLNQTEYVFLPISYQQFFKSRAKEVYDETNAWKAYLLSGGVQLACNEMVQAQTIPE